MVNGLARARLGRRRHRGRGGDARPADLHADPRGGRLPARPASCREGVTATDLVLTVTQMLRKKGVVGKFVEFYGPGLDALPLADRATIANMAPEYGATCGFFPIDAETLDYLDGYRPRRRRASRWSRPTPRRRACIATPARPTRSSPTRSSSISATVEPSLAGPKRPQDRVAARPTPAPAFAAALTGEFKQGRRRARRASSGRRRRTTTSATATW